MKNIYEVFDEFELAQTKQEKMKVIEKNLSPTLVSVLQYTFHPSIEWLIKDFPETYTIVETPPGMGHCSLSTELRKIYLFQTGNPNAQRISERRRTELLIILLESLEPREAEVVMGIFKKDQGVEGLTYEFVKEAFPQLLP